MLNKTQRKVDEMESVSRLHGEVAGWAHLPRGSYRRVVNGIELDVWKIGALGWRFNASKDGVYLGFEQGLISLDAACEAAVRFAETHGKPRIYEDM
jgi:hypothetical protein